VAGDGREVPVVSLPFQSPPPATAGVQLGQFDPSALAAAGFHGYLKFRVRWRSPGYPETESELVVHYTGGPTARFTGEFSEELEEGSLVIYVRVEVFKPGRFTIDGRLFGRNGETPVALAAAIGPLSQGLHRVPLRFHGLMFHDARTPGPYVLKGLHGFEEDLSSTGRGPEIQAHPGGYTTQAYGLAQFTQEEWTSPQKELILKTYDEEIRRLGEAQGGAPP
jgi:hypothetical protein